MPKALEDLKVLDFTRMYAGPFCPMLLAEMGADIIKVEIPGSGDAVRTLPPITDGDESYIFVILNRGKKSITLNLASEKGRDICRQLVEKVDVVIENFAPGVMSRLGMGYEDLKKINPKIIYASLSGFGQNGQNSSLVAFDTVAQAMGGLMAVNGFPDSPPLKTAPALADFLGSYYTTISILSALHYRDVTGEGQSIDISLQDCVWALTSIQHSPGYFLTGEPPQKIGNRQPEATPFNVYPAKDGHIVIAIVTVGQWDKFASLIGRDDLVGDPRYRTVKERIKHIDMIDEMVEKWTKTKTIDEIQAEFKEVRLACSPVPTFDQVANDAHLLERDMISEVEQAISGTLKVPGSVFKMSQTPGDPTNPAPFLGEHNRDVYFDLLGFDADEVDKLKGDGVI